MSKTFKSLSARKIALKVLFELEKTKFRKHADEEFYKIINDNPFVPVNDKNLAYEIISGCLRNKSLLEFHLSKFSDKPIEKIDHQLRLILIIAFYQMLFLNKIPDYAIVNEAVTLCAKNGWSKFVNAVLRTAMRNKEKQFSLPSVAIKFSHPEWLVKKLEKSFGLDKTIQILKWNNERPEVFAVILRQFDESIDDLVPDIAEPTEFSNDNLLRVINFQKLLKSKSFEKGNIYLITPWSVSVVNQLPLSPGMKILDMCAAPGGKSILTVCKENVEITAADNSPRRIEKLQSNLTRCKINNVKTIVADGRNALKIFGKNSFDAVLLDAPCSSVGVIREHPEIRWRLNDKSFSSRQVLQKQLLDSAKQVLKPNGFILYSVCSYAKEETEDVIESFLKENVNIKCVKAERNLPGENKMSGGFFALLQ